LRVAMFCHRVDERAIARLTISLCRELSGLGCDVALVAAGSDPTARRAVPSDVRLVDLHARLDTTMAVIPALARWLRKERPDVLFAQHNGPNRAAVVARALARVTTCIVTVEQNHYSSYMSPSGGGWKLRRLRDFMTGCTYARADRVAGVAPELVEDLEGRFPGVRGKTVLLPNPGLAPTELGPRPVSPADVPWLASPRPWRVVCSIANVIPRKGQDVLIAALPAVREAAGDVRLLLVGRIGNAAYHAALLRSAQELRVSEFVSFAGYRRDRISLLAASDAFALASRNEGAPLSILEAMSVGVPVVATDCPSGPAHLLDGGRCGRLAPVDDAAAVARGLVDVLTDAGLRDRLVAAARRRAAEFTPRRAAEAYLELARECRADRASDREEAPRVTDAPKLHRA